MEDLYCSCLLGMQVVNPLILAKESTVFILLSMHANSAYYVYVLSL